MLHWFLLLGIAVGCVFSSWRCVVAQQPSTTFDAVCFTPIEDLDDSRPADYWQQWLKKVPNHNSSIQPVNPRTGRGCRVNGTVQLVTSWSSDSLLRLQLKPQQNFRIHLFRGSQGVTLLYDARHHGWIAYVTSRQPNEPRPDRLTLAATDNGRARRSEFHEPVPIGLHCVEGELVLSRGDVVLLSVPFSDVPQEVYFGGRVELQAVACVEVAGLPAVAVADKRDVVRPATLGWTKKLGQGASFEIVAAGAVRLTAERADDAGWVTAPIPGSGPRELVVRLDHVSPGTGLFLATDDFQRPRSVIHFVRNQRDGRTCVVLSSNSQWHERNWKPFPFDAIPYVNDAVWVRLAFGAGYLRWWISTDGRHWAEAEQPIVPLQPWCTKLGLYHVRGVAGCKIEMGAIEIAPHKKLASFSAPQQLAAAVVVLGELPLDKDFAQWTEAVAQRCPTQHEAAAWNRACSVATLGTGCSPPIGVALLNQLMDQADQQAWPVLAQLQLFDEVSLLSDSRLLANAGPSLPTRYFRLGHQAWRRDGLPPLSSIRRAFMGSMLDRRCNVEWTMDGVAREEILALIYGEKWAELRHLCHVFDFFDLFRYEPLVVWADQLSATRLQADPIITGRRAPVISWRPLLIEELHRDVYNDVVEFDQLLKARDWSGAARHVVDVLADSPPGLAPSPDDPALLISAPAAIRAALRRYPELVTALENGYGELLQLRVERAIRNRQALALTQLTDQFPGLRASRQAEIWLADQLLAGGRARAALRHYRRAIEGHVAAQEDAAEKDAGEESVDDSLRARMSIAAALVGQVSQLKPGSDVQIGDVTLSPSELAKLTRDLLQRSIQLQGRAAARSSIYATTNVRAVVRGALQLDVGKDPGKEVLSGVDRYRVDWPGRQLAAVRVGDRLLVHNRFELVALDWATGQLRWTSHPMRKDPDQKTLRSRDWPLIAMAPLVHRQFVIARHLNAVSPQLGCWDLDSGQLVWSNHPDEEVPICDPFLIGDQLAVLTLPKQRSVDAILTLRFFTAATGRYRKGIPLLRLRDSWWTRSSCQVLANSQRLYVVLGGLSFCCDGDGNIRWVRATQATPPLADPMWIRQIHQPPLLIHDTLVIGQVGVRAIEAVDPETGVLRWHTVMPHGQQIVGAVGAQVVIKSQDRFSWLDVDSGRIRRQRVDLHLLLAVACSPEAGIVYTRSQSGRDDREKRTVQLVRLDGKTGRETGVWTLGKLAGSRPNIGPLIVGDDRAWAFFSLGVLGGQRDLVELLRVETPDVKALGGEDRQ